MAIFSSSTVRLLHQKLLLDGLDGWESDHNYAKATCYMSLHSGTQPTANTISENWTAYNWTNSSFLSLTPITISKWGNTGTYSASYQTGTGIRNGTAEWAVFMSVRANVNAVGSPVSTSTYTTSSYNLSSPPNSYFIVVPVSDSTGTGVVRLINPAISSGGVFTVTDISMMLGWN